MPELKWSSWASGQRLWIGASGETGQDHLGLLGHSGIWHLEQRRAFSPLFLFSVHSDGSRHPEEEAKKRVSKLDMRS